MDAHTKCIDEVRITLKNVAKKIRQQESVDPEAVRSLSGLADSYQRLIDPLQKLERHRRDYGNPEKLAAMRRRHDG